MAVASVVIPAHNEAATIGRNLRALREGTGSRPRRGRGVQRLHRPHRRRGPRRRPARPRHRDPAALEGRGRAGRQHRHRRLPAGPPRRRHRARRRRRAAADRADHPRRGAGHRPATRGAPHGVLALGAVVLRRLGGTAPGGVRPLRPRRRRPLRAGAGAGHRAPADDGRRPRHVRLVQQRGAPRRARRRRRRAPAAHRARPRAPPDPHRDRQRPGRPARRTTPGSRTSARTLLGLAVARPGLALRLPVFVAVHVAAQLGARGALRSGDFTTWQRDESSRT